MGKNTSPSPIPNPDVLCLVFVTISVSILTISTKMVAPQNITTTVPVKVGVVLNMETMVGKMGLSCINMALSDFYASHEFYKTRLVLHPRNCTNGVLSAASAALDLIKNVEVQAIIGPGTSKQAKFVNELGEKAQVPVISFSASSPSLTSTKSPYFFQATLSDSSQVNAIAALVQTFGWRKAVPVYTDDEYGREVIPYLADALQAAGAHIAYCSIISASASDDQIADELNKLMTMQTRVFIVHMSPLLASHLFVKANEFGMIGEGYVWIATDGITEYLSSFNGSVLESMQGVLGVKTYVPQIKNLDEFRARWKTKFHQDRPEVIDPELNIYGLYAYDVTMALAMAIEKSGTRNLSYKKAESSSSASGTALETFGVSLYGPNLLQALSDTKLRGITGDFFFVNGQLQSSTYQVVNVNGGARVIGYWTPTAALIKQLDSTLSNTSSYSTSNSGLASIIWPGDSVSVPKGWEIPTNGKMLRIGVPVKKGFQEFVNATRDPSSNKTKYNGYSTAVFNAAVKKLPYALGYEYIPFSNSDGKMAGTYDQLVYQVYLRHYDAVVGDVTIIADRSLYVDFTLPYTESGVYMVVPIKDNKSRNAWAFLKPLTWDLWAASFCFFVFIGFVVWVLEHRVNDEFRGPPSHQVGTSFWFSFSTMVFSQREKVVSNLARGVMLIWFFVVLILTQSYTASLTSLLTVQQLQPTVTDISELIKKGEYVGYLNGSFVAGLLKGLGFKDEKLLIYNSLEECHELFSKGNGYGSRIAAAFDEAPYIRLFLMQHCSKYTMIEPIFKTAGFGFVFPRGSPLVSDISRAILNVTEGDEMKQIEKKWFGEQTNCSESSTSVTSNSLGLDSFWGLFLISGSASLFAVLTFSVRFVNENRHVLLSSDLGASTRSRICNLLKIFNEKDYTSHTFRKSEVNNDRDSIALPISVSGAPSPYSCHTISLPSTGAPSPFSHSVHSDFHGDQGMPSAELDPCLGGQPHEDMLTTNSEQRIHSKDRTTELAAVTIENEL